MRWIVFGIVAFVAVVLETSMRHMFALRFVGSVAPSFVAIVAVYVALFSPRETGLWAMWILGLLVDLVSPLRQGDFGAGPLLGPHALGYVFAGYLLIQVRGMLFRRQVLTVAVMSVLFVIVASVVVVFLYAVHGVVYPKIVDGQSLSWADHGPLGEFFRRAGDGVYTGLLAVPLGALLVWSLPLWGFRLPGYRHGTWR